MDFWKTLGVLLRRWYVAVPVFGISLVLAGGVYLKTPTTYESTGTMVLTAPTAGANVAIDPAKATGPGNPLLDFEGSLTITTQLLIQSLSSPAVQQQIATQGGSGTFQAGDGETGGPFVVIIADAKSPAQAELTVTLALKYAQNELDARQKNLNAPPSTYIGTQSVVSPTNATTKISGKVRTAGVALVVGLVLSLATAYGIESWSSHRRRKQAAAASAGDDEQRDEYPPDEVDELDESALPTKKMRAAPPPQQPVRSGGPRPTPHPTAAPHREHHPRPVPTPVPTTGAGGVNGKAASNGSGSRHDWPSTEFTSPDSPTG